MAKRTRSPEVQSQMFDVQLLDLFAEVEAILRGGRELQRDALRLRGVAPANSAQRRAATRRIQKGCGQMRKECQALSAVVAGLANIADGLRRTEAARSI